MKECFKCKLTKPLSDFYKHSQMKDGHLNKCKLCNKKDVSSNYRANIEHYKEYERSRSNLEHRVKAREDYAKTEKGKVAGNNGKKAWQIRNPIKRMASTIVGNAVRDGKIEKPLNCESCDSQPVRLHGHHDDYAFPLVVRWLCPGCHNNWHKENGEGLNSH
jgi:hypothetical protein